MARRNHGATQHRQFSPPEAPPHQSSKQSKGQTPQNILPNSALKSQSNTAIPRRASRGGAQMSAFSTPSVTFQKADSEIQIVEVVSKDARIDMSSAIDRGLDSNDQSSHAWKRKRRRQSREEIRSAPYRKIEHFGDSSRCGENMLTGILSVFITVVVSVPISLLILLTLPMALLVKTLGTACFQPRISSCCHQYQYLSSHDAYFVSQPSQSVMHSILIIDGMLPLAKIRQIVASRVIEAKNSSGELLYPRFTDRVKILSAGPAWVRDQSFHIHHHIYLGPNLMSQEELQNYVSDLMSKPLSLDRPLWEIIVVGGGGDDRSNKDTILVCRIHPCVADGISLMRVLCHALSDNQVQNLPAKPHFGATTYATSVMLSFLFAPFTLIKWLCFWPEENNLLTNSYYFIQKEKRGAKQNKTTANSRHNDVNRRRSRRPSGSSTSSNRIHNDSSNSYCRSTINEGHVVKWRAGISLPKVTRVKLVTRTSLNDVILSSVAGSLRKTLQKRGLHNPPDLMATVAVDLRSRPLPFTPLRLGFKASLVPVPLPLECDAAVPRLWRVRESMDELKASGDSVVFWLCCSVCHWLLPKCWGEPILNRLRTRGSVHYASLPAPTAAIQIGGYTIKNIYTAVPPPSTTPVSVSVVTYANQIHISCTVRKDVYRPKSLAKSIVWNTEQQLEQLSELLSNRRLPGETRRPMLMPSDGTATTTAPVSELQAKLARVQNELQAVTSEYEAVTRNNESKRHFERRTNTNSQASPSTSSGGPDPSGMGSSSLSPPEEELATKVLQLKEEFTVLLAEIRRRRSIGDGATTLTFQMSNNIDEDGEVLRFRKRTLSNVTMKSMVPPWESTCTARPLTAPTHGSKNPSSNQKMKKSDTLPVGSKRSKNSNGKRSSANEPLLSNEACSSDTPNDLKVLSIDSPSLRRNNSGDSSTINSILKPPSHERDKRSSASSPLTITGHSLSQPGTSGHQSSQVTWKDQSSSVSSKGSAIKDSLSTAESINDSPKTPKTNHQVKVNLPSPYQKRDKTQPIQSSTQKLSSQLANSGHHPSSQADITPHPARGVVPRPKSMHGSLDYQQPTALSNSTCILHPMACMPSSSLESTTSVIPKSMQRPTSIPPRTIHPSLRSHFAIEKSTEGSSVHGQSTSERLSGGSFSSKRNQPITTPLLHNSETSPMRVKQSYQHLHEQLPHRSSKNIRIETDIM